MTFNKEERLFLTIYAVIHCASIALAFLAAHFLPPPFSGIAQFTGTIWLLGLFGALIVMAAALWMTRND